MPGTLRRSEYRTALPILVVRETPYTYRIANQERTNGLTCIERSLLGLNVLAGVRRMVLCVPLRRIAKLTRRPTALALKLEGILMHVSVRKDS